MRGEGRMVSTTIYGPGRQGCGCQWVCPVDGLRILGAPLGDGCLGHHKGRNSSRSHSAWLRVKHDWCCMPSSTHTLRHCPFHSAITAAAGWSPLCPRCKGRTLSFSFKFGLRTHNVLHRTPLSQSAPVAGLSV